MFETGSAAYIFIVFTAKATSGIVVVFHTNRTSCMAIVSKGIAPIIIRTPYKTASPDGMAIHVKSVGYVHGIPRETSIIAAIGVSHHSAEVDGGRR